MIDTSLLFNEPHKETLNGFDQNNINTSYLSKIVKLDPFKELGWDWKFSLGLVFISAVLWMVSWIFWIPFIIYRINLYNKYNKKKESLLNDFKNLPKEEHLMKSILATIHSLYDPSSSTSWLGNTSYRTKEDEKIILLSIEVLRIDQLSDLKGLEQLKTKVKDIIFKRGEKIELYRKYLASIILAVTNIVFELDTENQYDTLVVNLYYDGYDSAYGSEKRYFLASCQFNKEIFKKINLYYVDPVECVRTHSGRIFSVSKNSSTIPITPIIQFDTDNRIIYSEEVIGNIDTDLMQISWEDFEVLVRDWLKKEFANETTKVEVTQASRDGGVDAIIYDQDYLKGGKTVVQVKQYTNVVGVSAVRDLWGVANHENASRGILVTTSHFGSDSFEFAKDKPISLINGEQLLDYLKKHGYNFKIGSRDSNYQKFF